MTRSDILTVAWKEWLEFRDQLLRIKRGGLSALIVILMLGIITPLQMGPLWLESPLMLAYWPLLSSGWSRRSSPTTLPASARATHAGNVLASRLSDTRSCWEVLAAILYGLLFTFANIIADHHVVGRNLGQGSRRRPPFTSPSCCCW